MGTLPGLFLSGENGPGASSSSESSFSRPAVISMADWEKENNVAPEKLAGEYTSKFHQMCNQRGVVPKFSFNDSPPFTCSVRVGNETLGKSDPHGTKKLAKEKLCEDVLSTWLSSGKWEQKRKLVDSVAEMVSNEHDAVLMEENWIGILQEYTQSLYLPLPKYEELLVKSPTPLFAYSVKFVTGPLTPFEGCRKARKDLAKRAAAREAVIWLRKQGHLHSGPSSQHPKPIATTAARGDTELSPAGQSVDGEGQGVPQARTVPQRVVDLAVSLGFSQPRYEFEQGAGSVVNVAAYFTEQDCSREPKLKGPLGQCSGVSGKKKAKEECCAKVLSVLEDIKSIRTAT